MPGTGLTLLAQRGKAAFTRHAQPCIMAAGPGRHAGTLHSQGDMTTYPELLLHGGNLGCAALQLIQPHSVSAKREAVLSTFGIEQAGKHADELQVAGGGDIVEAPQLRSELLAGVTHLQEPPVLCGASWLMPVLMR